MSISDTYAALEEALTAHIRALHGPTAFVPHWVLVAGVHDMNNPTAAVVQTTYATDVPEYALTGLLEWARIQFVPESIDTEDPE